LLLQAGGDQVEDAEQPPFGGRPPGGVRGLEAFADTDEESADHRLLFENVGGGHGDPR
jgi:hypothetical protein